MKTPIYKTPNGVRYLNALFLETSYTDQTYVIYTLKDQDHNGYTSLYLKYMEMEDVTEYDFANAYFDNWDHWEMLCKCKWFQPYLHRWRKELDLKLKTEAIRVIRAEIKDPSSKNKFQAAKMIIDRVWESKKDLPLVKRGRPQKVDETSEEQQAADDKLLEEFHKIIKED